MIANHHCEQDHQSILIANNCEHWLIDYFNLSIYKATAVSVKLIEGFLQLLFLLNGYNRASPHDYFFMNPSMLEEWEIYMVFILRIQENNDILPDIHSNIAIDCLKNWALQTNLFYEYYKA